MGEFRRCGSLDHDPQHTTKLRGTATCAWNSFVAADFGSFMGAMRTVHA